MRHHGRGSRSNMALSQLCTFPVEEKVCAWGWGMMETSHSEREAQRSGWESLSPTLHHVFMGSLWKALYAFTPPPPFSLSPVTSEESSQPTIRSHKPSAYNSHWKSKCQSLDNVTGVPYLVFHTQLSSHQSPETHSLPIRSFLTWQPCSPFRF